MESEVYYATGKRKSAIARVRLIPGEGKYHVNQKSLDDYFTRETSKMIIKQPTELTETAGKFDVLVKVHGGGMSSQAGAIRHGRAGLSVRGMPSSLNEDSRRDPSKTGFPSIATNR